MTAEQKLLLDEMLSGEIAVQLRARGHDVIAVVEDPTLVATPDEQLLEHATSVGRCLVTANVRDFAAIHGSASSQGLSGGRCHGHAGLIYVVNRVFPSDRSFVGAVVEALHDLMVDGHLSADGAETFLRRRRP